MIGASGIRLAVAALGLLVLAPSLKAEPRPPQADSRPSALGTLGSNKEPIKIDSDRLDVFDKEQRAVFSGDVVAVQGDSTIRCTQMTVLYEQQRGQDARTQTPGGDNSSIKRIDCKGPVTIVSKDQVATGDNAVFDRAANKVLLTGNVALSQCQNVTRGERIVYNLATGIANVETAPGGRVRAVFVPGGGGDSQPKQGCQQPAAPAQASQPAPQPAAAKPPSPKPQRRTPAAQTD